MSEWISQAEAIFSLPRLLALSRALVLLGAGWIVARLVRGALRRVASGRLEAQQERLLQRFAYYIVLALFFVAALHQLGFNLSVLLGAGGIVAVAVGFASQTSASNFISGLFLIAERPFGVGDAIRIGETTGEVLSIDLLSVKLRTWDNLYVRIPNEQLIKTELKSLTRFPLRRVDLKVSVAYKEDLRRVSQLMLEVAQLSSLGLLEPAPLIMITGFGDSSIDFQYSVWGRRESYMELKHTLQIELKEAFDREGIEIPFPHRTLKGAADDPLPVRLVQGDTGGDSGQPS